MEADERKQVVEEIIEACLQEGILVDLLRENGVELVEAEIRRQEQLDMDNRYFRIMFNLGKAHCKAEGMVEGKEKAQILIAKKLLGMEVNTLQQIAQITGLSEYELRLLKRCMVNHA